MGADSAVDPVDAIRRATGDLGARGIADAVRRLIRAGELTSGTKLPTVRQIAGALGVSPATVSAAWRELSDSTLIETRRRGGSIVRDTVPHAPKRTESIFNASRRSRFTTDLSRIVPDPALLPKSDKAFVHALAQPQVNEYSVAPITDSLRGALELPAHHEAAMAVNGGYDGIALISRALISPGDVVAVEEPTSPRLMDIIEWVGGRVVPVACDDGGPSLSGLRDALQRRPRMFFFQSRAQSPSGHSVSRQRILDMFAIVHPTDILTVEVDSQPGICQAPLELLADLRPAHGLQVRSFSKSLGPDLRLGAVIGPTAVIDQIIALRSYDSGWTSRIIQEAAAWLLTDPRTRQGLRTAATTYAHRRHQLLEALRDRGFSPAGEDGMVAWVPVRDEYAGVAVLASHGIAASPGRPFYFRNPSRGHLRLSAGRLHSGFEHIAEVLLDAETAG